MINSHIIYNYKQESESKILLNRYFTVYARKKVQLLYLNM